MNDEVTKWWKNATVSNLRPEPIFCKQLHKGLGCVVIENLIPLDVGRSDDRRDGVFRLFKTHSGLKSANVKLIDLRWSLLGKVVSPVPMLGDDISADRVQVKEIHMLWEKTEAAVRMSSPSIGAGNATLPSNDHRRSTTAGDGGSAEKNKDTETLTQPMGCPGHMHPKQMLLHADGFHGSLHLVERWGKFLG